MTPKNKFDYYHKQLCSIIYKITVEQPFLETSQKTLCYHWVIQYKIYDVIGPQTVIHCVWEILLAFPLSWPKIKLGVRRNCFLCCRCWTSHIHTSCSCSTLWMILQGAGRKSWIRCGPSVWIIILYQTPLRTVLNTFQFGLKTSIYFILLYTSINFHSLFNALNKEQM